jgi:3-isopropylmalate/(R)-2-methylmalate dehydratase large subunit
VVENEDGATVLYIDRHYLHEGMYQRARQVLEARHLRVRRPMLCTATTDHFVPSDPARRRLPVSTMAEPVSGFMSFCEEFGIEVFGPTHALQGIAHVLGPETGLSQPGMTIACADSHTSTHGALGALAFGIGSTEAAHILATQCLVQYPDRTMRVAISGHLQPGVAAKDVMLRLLSDHGTNVGVGYAIEYAGPCVRAMTMEERLTLCNMTIELGARCGMIGPDDTTVSYLAGRQFAPDDAAWDASVAFWLSLASDEDAVFDAELSLDASTVRPMVTYGTKPSAAAPVDGCVPRGHPATAHEPDSDYMCLPLGQPIAGNPVQVVFIGSCTNGRLEDLRAAATILDGHRVAQGVRLVVVPGSQQVKRLAEEEGLDQVFIAAGGLWGESGCSMCVGANGDIGEPGQYIASTSNRNFRNRQGPGTRTLLMSPMTAAATAIEGAVADPRRYLESRRIPSETRQ